jgi:hypothetical protein
MTEEIRKNKDRSVQNRNLIPARLGEVRNPKGRGKGNLGLWGRIKKKLKEQVKDGPHAGKRYADLAADAYVKECLRGEFRHLKELMDRDDGVPPIPITVLGADPKILNEDELAAIERILESACRRAGGTGTGPSDN